MVAERNPRLRGVRLCLSVEQSAAHRRYQTATRLDPNEIWNFINLVASVS